jgi:hypothetical protein
MDMQRVVVLYQLLQQPKVIFFFDNGEHFDDFE